MKRRGRFLLPDAPDVIGLLRAQAAVTVAGMEAMLAWAQGDAEAAERVRLLEHDADARRREVRDALTQLFAPPLDPEDLFTLSRTVVPRGRFPCASNGPGAAETNQRSGSAASTAKAQA